MVLELFSSCLQNQIGSEDDSKIIIRFGLSVKKLKAYWFSNQCSSEVDLKTCFSFQVNLRTTLALKLV
jgi:hypothetical protein